MKPIQHAFSWTLSPTQPSERHIYWGKCVCGWIEEMNGAEVSLKDIERYLRMKYVEHLQ